MLVCFFVVVVLFPVGAVQVKAFNFNSAKRCQGAPVRVGFLDRLLPYKVENAINTNKLAELT